MYTSTHLYFFIYFLLSFLSFSFLLFFLYFFSQPKLTQQKLSTDLVSAATRHVGQTWVAALRKDTLYVLDKHVIPMI